MSNFRFSCCIWLVSAAAANAQVNASAQQNQCGFIHPGTLHTQPDLDRMREKVAQGAQPWKSTWDLLVASPWARLTHTPRPQAVICRGGGCAALGYPENYITLARDIGAAYGCALRWYISGDASYADKAVEIMNAWPPVLQEVTGDSNVSLAAGTYGWEFAVVGDLMRSYSGWARGDQAAFKDMMLSKFYTLNHDFLTRHHNTCASHYRANWDAGNIAAVLAIGVLVDDPFIFEEGVSYFKNGIGNGNVTKAVYFVHPDGSGQCEESGRDQPHATLGLGWLSIASEIAWNQGVDLYGYDNNRLLRGLEYAAKYNLGNDVPYIAYQTCDQTYFESVISSNGRGNIRPMWELAWNHYVNRKGLAAPFSKQYAEAMTRPEAGAGYYGPNSGGFDLLGYGTLTASLDPIPWGAIPSGLIAKVVGTQIALSWWGSAYATSYNVKVSPSAGGPYATIGNVPDTTFTDYGMQGATSYYVTSAISDAGESADSDEISVAPNDLLTGTVIGSPGSYRDAGGTIGNVFDGSFITYHDAANASGDWAGLDLGTAKVITQVKYSPRRGFASRMVGGVFQGANVEDFSSGAVTLFTISTAPPDGEFTTQAITEQTAFRYVRYLGPANANDNVAEVEFHGNAP